MRIPRTPPSFRSPLDPFRDDPSTFIQAEQNTPPTHRYYHWDKLRHLTPPRGLTSEQWWAVVKFRRSQSRKYLPIQDASGAPFSFMPTEAAEESLYFIDREAAGQILIAEEVTNPDVRDRYVINSLMEEAITSSQIEGAATTSVVAKQLLRSGRAPRSVDEQMISNNYAAMQEIRQLKGASLDIDLILKLHRILTLGTLENAECAGRFRTSADPQIHVVDHEEQVLHTPPKSNALSLRMASMLSFANGQSPSGFLHPVLRAIILHFWLAYDHPFVDGNGRCARALFYWSMLRSNYWLCEFISISQRIRKAHVKYGRAFLYTETDDNDLTYFILYHLELIRSAIEDLQTELKRKMTEVRRAEQLLRHADGLNHRQIALLSHALRHLDADYTIAAHQNSNQTVYQTARQDLLDLQRRGLLEGRRIGKAFHFFPASNLENRMKKLR